MDRRRFLAAVPALAVMSRFPRFVLAGKTEPAAVASGNAAFAFDLYSKLAAKPGNLFYSPYSISAALAMTSRGTGGDTLKEMSSVLHLPLDSDHVHADFASLDKSLTSNAGKGAPELLIANALWAQAGFPFKDDFLKVTKEHYGAALKHVDFGKTEAARKEINDWVAKQTKDKIKELFASGVLDNLTRLVLTNAIYFKGTWKTQFEKHATTDAPFFGPTEVKLPTMHQTIRMPYAQGDGWQAIELPYRSSDLAMLIVLPRDRNGLAALDSKLTAESITQWTSKLNNEMVALSLPRFKSSSEFSLAKTLIEMGMGKAFGKDADFSRMTPELGLFIQAVVHKAVVEVNEEGTEAAAATGVAVGVRSAAPPREPKVFNADHPFLYFIRDTKSGAVLFMGRLTDPKG